MNALRKNNEKNLIIDVKNLQTLAQDILDLAKKNGASDAEVDVALNKGFTVTARELEVETVEYHLDKNIEITVFMGKRTGTASLSDFGMDAIKKAVEAACHIAKFTDEDEAQGLADKDTLAFDYPNLMLSFPWDLSVDDAILLAKECEAAGRQFDKKIVGAEPASVATMEAFRMYANTENFMGFYPYTHHEISCVLLGKNGDEIERDHSYSIAVDPLKLASAHFVGTEAARRTVNRLGARRLKTMKTPVIFVAEVASSLLKYFIGAIAGSNLYRQSSFLLDHINKKVFPSFVHIEEQPHLPFGVGSAPFDGEGVRTRPNIFVEEGILKQYCLSTYSARKLNMKTTGNADGVHNLMLRPGEYDLNNLLSHMGTGLLVTEMMGNGVNILTGDFSRGAAGFWIENGKIQYPVHEITIASNLREMFLNVVAIGTDVDVRSNIRTGSIFIAEMMVAGE